MTTITEAVQDVSVARLFLFVRRADDLASACRQVEEFLAYCRSRPSDSFANERFLGAWVDKHTVTNLPQEWGRPLSATQTLLLTIREIFALWGIWSVASIEAVCRETNEGMGFSHNLLLDALIALTQGDTGTVGVYSPVFARGTPMEQVHAEIKQLTLRYPLRIADPIYCDPDTGALSLQDELSCH
ncbi:hypothetical protein [Acidithiobacillus ferrivorans]|nr:hypothetical protein [Acidithiobacillus ferrivorans]MBN6742159.1 hypothetical protein [Acidithiobacillus sp. MC6.1]QQD73333.1 hypothetical protein H2515_03225 [Acidithiobacillus ferrivorans]